MKSLNKPGNRFDFLSIFYKISKKSNLFPGQCDKERKINGTGDKFFVVGAAILKAS